MASGHAAWAEHLPELCSVLVFRLLDELSLCRVAQSCSAWRELSETEDVWKSRCTELLIPALPGESSKTTYRRWYSKFRSIPNFAYHHKRMRLLQERLNAWLEIHAPRIAKSLHSGGEWNDIQRIETSTGELMDDLRMWLLLVNGQSRQQAGKKFGLFGGLQFYDFCTNMRLMSVQEIGELHSMLNSQRTSVHQWLLSVVPVVQSFNRESFWFALKQDSELSGFPGVVFKKGTIVVPSRGMRACFPLAESFYALLAHHIQCLEDGTYSIENGEIQRFPVRGIPVEITRHVRIRPSPVFIPEQSLPGQSYMWAYRVHMDMADDAPEEATCQLTTRAWTITDGAGRTQEVAGPGVIGLYPKMEPGAVFSYESCCPLGTPTGHMEGSFQMRVASSGAQFDAIVPRFQFMVPPILKE